MSTVEQRQEWARLASDCIGLGTTNYDVHAAARAAVPALLADVDALTEFAATQYQAGWNEAMRTADALHVDLTQEDVDNTAARQFAWQGDKIRALTAERDALAAELAAYKRRDADKAYWNERNEEERRAEAVERIVDDLWHM